MAELHTGRRHIPLKLFNIFSSSPNLFTKHSNHNTSVQAGGQDVRAFMCACMHKMAVLQLLMQIWDSTRRRQSHWLARDQTHSLPSWSPWETTPATAASLFTMEYGIWVRGHRAGSGDVMRLDTMRKGSNGIGDEDRRRYNDQVLTDGPFGP